MARLKVLIPKEIQAVYGIPVFTPEERDVYFSLAPQEKQTLEKLRHLTAKLYFILQLGYFKAKRQFFVFALRSVADDVGYILCRYFHDAPQISDTTISKPTRLAQ